MHEIKHCGRETRHADHIYVVGDGRPRKWFKCSGYTDGQEPVIFPEPASIPQEAVDAHQRALGITVRMVTGPEFVLAQEAISAALKALIELQYCVHD